jgi:RTA1 like protein
MPDVSCPDICTLATCNLSCAEVTFLPTLAGNATFAAIMGVLLIAQTAFGIRFRTWGFLVGMVCGLVLEIVGYAGRIMLHHDPFDFNNFLM